MKYPDIGTLYKRLLGDYIAARKALGASDAELSRDPGVMVYRGAVKPTKVRQYFHAATYMHIDAAVAIVLAERPEALWMTSRLADALRMKLPGCPSSKSLQSYILPGLRETKGTHCGRCYNAALRRWTWKPENNTRTTDPFVRVRKTKPANAAE